MCNTSISVKKIAVNEAVLINMRTVFENGVIYHGTCKSAFETCTTMVINDGRIEYLGNDAGRRIPSLSNGEDSKIVDLEGRSVFPAFIDAHMHLLQFGASLVKSDSTTVAISATSEGPLPKLRKATLKRNEFSVEDGDKLPLIAKPSQA